MCPIIAAVVAGGMGLWAWKWRVIAPLTILTVAYTVWWVWLKVS